MISKPKDKIKEIIGHEDSRFQIAAIVFLFVNCIILAHICRIEYYPYDAKYYWTITDNAYSNGHLDFLLFPETFRGCLYPLLLLILKVVFKGVWGWRILYSVMVTGLFGVFLPKMIGYSLNTIKDVIRVIIAELVFFFFWGNYLQYPLSDLPATFFLCAAVFFLKCSLDVIKKEQTHARAVKVIGLGLCSGACLYAAYNTRVVFLYGIIFVIIALLISLIKNHALKSSGFLAVGIIAGVIVLSIPQCMINKQYVGRYSPKVYTDQQANYTSSLQTQQILWGLSYARYETYLGNPEQYPSPSVYFDDPIGSRIIEKEQISIDNFGMKELFRLFLKYPLDFTGIYTRHLISLCTPAWNQLYISDLFTNKAIIALVSILIWLAAGVFFISRFGTKKEWDSIIYIGAICVPSVLQLVGAVEVRFFLPVYILLYAYVFCVTDVKELFGYFRPRLKTIIPVLLVILILWITVFADTLSFSRGETFLINDRYVQSGYDSGSQVE